MSFAAPTMSPCSYIKDSRIIFKREWMRDRFNLSAFPFWGLQDSKRSVKRATKCLIRSAQPPPTAHAPPEHIHTLHKGRLYEDIRERMNTNEPDIRIRHYNQFNKPTSHPQLQSGRQGNSQISTHQRPEAHHINKSTSRSTPNCYWRGEDASDHNSQRKSSTYTATRLTLLSKHTTGSTETSL